MYIFGLNKNEVDELWTRGYNSSDFYSNNERLVRIINKLNAGFAGESFCDIASYLISGHGVADPYMCLADFESYRITRERALSDYKDKKKWNRMSLINISSAGYFTADRAIKDYADKVWGIKPI
jgi:starch phosphorylase